MSDWKKMVCDYKACSKIATQEWRATGRTQYGTRCIECVYCDHHSRTHAEQSRTHTVIALIDRGGDE